MKSNSKNHTNNEENDDVWTITICSQTMEDLHFRVKRTYPMKKIFEKYCQRMEIAEPDTLQFLFDGDVIDYTLTVEQVGLTNHDKIEAVQNQVGGCFL